MLVGDPRSLCFFNPCHPRNMRIHFPRNYLRHEIMPRLQRHWPATAATLARSALHCAESQALLEEFALSLCKETAGTLAHTLSVTKLQALTPERQRLVLRTWISSQGYVLPDAKKIATIMRDVLTAARDRFPCVHWGEVELRRYRDDLFLMPLLPQHDHQQTLLLF